MVTTRSRITPTWSLLPVVTSSGTEHVGLDLDILHKDGGRRRFRGAHHGVELAGDPAHALALVVGAMERGDLELRRGDRLLHGVEFGPQLVDFGDLAAIGLDDLGGEALARIEEGAQFLDRGEDLIDLLVVHGVDGRALGQEIRPKLSSIR